MANNDTVPTPDHDLERHFQQAWRMGKRDWYGHGRPP